MANEPKQAGVVTIHGVEYHTVAKRVSDWREKYKVEDGWMVATEILEHSEGHCLVKAQLVDPGGRTIATGHAMERTSALANSMIDSLVEVAETSAVGRALAFAGFGGGGPIASADEMTRRVPLGNKKLVSPVKHREVVEALRRCFEDDDSFGVLEIRREWENEEWAYIAGSMQSWERSAIAKHLDVARKAENSAIDPNYEPPQPVELREKDQLRQARKQANG